MFRGKMRSSGGLRSVSALLLLLLLLAATFASAHELQANRATLVLREQRHLTLTLYLDYASALHQALSPEVGFPEFIAVQAAMTPEEFRAELDRAQAKFESGTRLALANGEALALAHWTWPDASALQASMQQRAMQLIVAPEEHAHVESVEIHAEATATVAIDTLSLSLPPEFGQVLVVWFSPQQRWVQQDAEAVQLRF